MKNLDDFIRKNRNAFDDREPSEKVWRGVEEMLPVRPERSWWNSAPLWRAAAIILLGVCIYLLVPKQTTRADVALNEFADIEQFYVQQISEKTQLIDEFRKDDGLNGFTTDFRQLEAMYMVLKEEMRNRPSQKVKDALVLNLLVRIDLLNQQLHKLDLPDTEKDSKDNKPSV